MKFIQLVRDLKQVWAEQIERKRAQEEKYRIEYAFTSGGTKYYRYADIQNLPYERGLTALLVYNEVEMRCSRSLLKKYVKAVKDILRENPIDIYKLNSLVEMLEQRLALTADVELLYKLASVVFFDKSENPCVYEQAYAERKIEKWKKEKSAKDFFLQRPLKELIPFLGNAEFDIDAYSRLNEEVNRLHSQLLRMSTSPEKQSSTTNGE